MFSLCMNRSRESYAYYKLDKEKTYLFYRLVFLNICLYNFLCTGGAKDMVPGRVRFCLRYVSAYQKIYLHPYYTIQRTMKNNH